MVESEKEKEMARLAMELADSGAGGYFGTCSAFSQLRQDVLNGITVEPPEKFISYLPVFKKVHEFVHDNILAREVFTARERKFLRKVIPAVTKNTIGYVPRKKSMFADAKKLGIPSARAKEVVSSAATALHDWHSTSARLPNDRVSHFVTKPLFHYNTIAQRAQGAMELNFKRRK